jgi:mRNA-degrading endonuclease RelE of RelBE toxin-antitoxin system
MYEIELTPEAFKDLAAFRKFDQVRIPAGMEAQLKHEPANETRNRKRLRPNQLAEWALRIDEFRVFYDVTPAEPIVKIVAVAKNAETTCTVTARNTNYENDQSPASIGRRCATIG